MIGMTMHHAGIVIARAKLAHTYLDRSVNNSEIYSPETAVKAGFLDQLVPEQHVLANAIKAATLFAKLNTKAHAETKLKVRKPHLEALEKAIELDLQEEIRIG